MSNSPSLRFLLDENVPAVLARLLRDAGHDVARMAPRTPDLAVAAQAKKESRIILTLDNDFSNHLMFPPKEITIILIRIHPPVKNELREAVRKLLEVFPSPQGFILLEKTGPTRTLG